MRITIIIALGLMIIGCNQTKKTNIEEKSNDCDDNFYAFNQSFISEKAFQLSHSKIENWNYTNMYSDKDYTLEVIEKGYKSLDDNEKDIINEKHLTYFALKDSIVTDYLFKKLDCKWILVEKNSINLSKYDGQEFLNFIKEFSTDSVFMNSRIKYPLKYEFLGDDGSMQEKLLNKGEEERFDFFGEGYILFLNSGKFSNMKQFQIALRGIGCGLHSNYYFNEIDDSLKLVKYNDFSM